MKESRCIVNTRNKDQAHFLRFFFFFNCASFELIEKEEEEEDQLQRSTAGRKKPNNLQLQLCIPGVYFACQRGEEMME